MRTTRTPGACRNTSTVDATHRSRGRDTRCSTAASPAMALPRQASCISRLVDAWHRTSLCWRSSRVTTALATRCIQRQVAGTPHRSTSSLRCRGFAIGGGAPVPVRMSAGLLASIQSLHDSITADSSKLVVMLFDDGLTPAGQELENRVLGVLREAGVPVLSLGATLKAIARDDRIVHPQLDPSPNDVAHAAAATELHRFLRTQGLLEWAGNSSRVTPAVPTRSEPGARSAGAPAPRRQQP